MFTLREVFTPLIAYTLFLTGTPAEYGRPFANIRGDLERLLEEQKTSVKRSDISPQDYENASFAVIAWVDEAITRCAHESNPELLAEWRRAPLQAQLFKTANAGEEFFERLAELTPTQKQVIELYHLMLCLGFRGRFYDESQEPRLIELRRQYAAYLPAPLVEPLDFENRQEHLTPEPYSIPTPQVRPVRRRLSPYWLAVPAIAVAVLLLYFWPREPSQQAVEDAVRGFDCATIEVVQIEKRQVTLTGHVASEEQFDEVRSKVLSVRGVKSVTEELTVIPWPFCKVMEVLAPFRNEERTSAFGLTINPSKGCDSTYYYKENLAVEIKAKRPLNYLYVDYYEGDREEVAHMLPNPRRTDNALNDSRTITIGDAQDKQSWDIQPPFGREMVMVISSPRPLFSERPISETAGGYLASLEMALKSETSNPSVIADYCFTISAEH
jgi:type VI secretion system protein ImpK